MKKDLYLDCAEVVRFANEFKEKRETLNFAKQEEEIDEAFWKQPTFTLSLTSWGVDQCCQLILKHMKRNMASSAIFYCGDHYDPLIKDAGVKHLQKLGKMSSFKTNMGRST